MRGECRRKAARRSRDKGAEEARWARGSWRPARGRAHPASRLVLSPAGAYPGLVSDGCFTLDADAAIAPTSPSTGTLPNDYFPSSTTSAPESRQNPLPDPRPTNNSSQGGPWTGPGIFVPLLASHVTLGVSFLLATGFLVHMGGSCEKLPERQLDLKERG